MDKKAKFFCEYCGTEVRQNDKVCPRCGKFFASVKCPSCGFSGDSRIFRDGCPMCGYAVNRDQRAAPKREGQTGKTDPLPWWIYVVSLLLLATMVALLVIRQ